MADVAARGVTTPRASWLSVGGIGVVDALAAVVLSAGVVVIVHVDLYASDPHGDLLAAAVATMLTLPVLWARRYPLAAASVVALGGLVNWLFLGHYIRCGAAVPAAFWLACAIGLRLRGRRAALALLLVMVGLQAMCLADAALIPASTILLAPMVLAFWLIGRTIRSRTDTNDRIAIQNAELETTRQRTAQLAVINDRARISAGLDRDLRQNLEELAETAAAGRNQLDDPPSAQDAFATIARRGRRTLTAMRDVVDALHIDAPFQPPADLSWLGDLVNRHGGSLVVRGDPRPLPDALELSGYRIVEQLLRTFDDSSTPVDVQVDYGADTLELRVSGRASTAAVSGPEVTVARQRVEFHGGGLTADRQADRLLWVARVPLTVP